MKMESLLEVLQSIVQDPLQKVKTIFMLIQVSQFFVVFSLLLLRIDKLPSSFLFYKNGQGLSNLTLT
jgi:hypothetical protein